MQAFRFVVVVHRSELFTEADTEAQARGWFTQVFPEPADKQQRVFFHGPQDVGELIFDAVENATD